MFPSLPLLWSRFLAFAVDYLFIALYLLLLVGVGALIRLTPLGADFGALFTNPASAELTSFMLLVLPVLLYFALLESSRWQATIGKRVMGLRVTTLDDGRVGFLRALLRNALKLIPWELAHTCLWRIPGWPLNPQEPPIWVTLGLVLVWVVVAVYAIGLAISRTGQTPYDHLANVRVERIIPNPFRLLAFVRTSVRHPRAPAL
jgi:RDD family protein